MAKGKHAAALFEVIHADRRFGKKTPPALSLSTPKWWFKGKKTQAPPASSAAAAPAAPVAPAPAAPHVAGAPEPIEFLPAVPGDPTAARPVDVKVNPDRQEISFKLTYTSAIVGGFTLLVVLSLAYVIGRKMSAGPAGAVAATVSTNDIRKGAPQPGVMDLAKAARDGTPLSIAPDRNESARVIDAAPAPRNATPAQQRQQHNPGQTTLVVDDPNRTIGLNYVVIQSFRHEQKALADEAVKYLREGGIGATTVKDLPGWQGWYSVVGTRGFDSVRSNPQYDAYKAQIMEISPKFAGRSQWKRFAPTPKKWTGNP